MTRFKKIAILCNYELLPERVGGMDYFFWQFDAQCKSNNIQVDWFFPNSSNHGGYSELTIKDSGYQNVETFFLKSCKEQKLEFSYIITHFIELCTPFFKKISQQSNAKIIVVDHNSRPINGYSLKKKITKKIKGFLYSKHIDLFVGVSKYSKKEIIKDFGNCLKNRVCIIYNGVTFEDILIRNKRNTIKPKFLVVSHLTEAKGIQDLIQAVYLLPEAIKKEIVIDIYGDGPYRKQLETLVLDLELCNSFQFMGSSSLLKSIYCQYDYMLQPTHMECFSLSILESLAANVPVITTNVGGNEEAVVNNLNGYIYRAKDINALAEILEEVYLGIKKIELNTRLDIEKRFSLAQMVHNHIQLVL